MPWPQGEHVMSRDEVIFFHGCRKVGIFFFLCWKPNQPKRETLSMWIWYYYCALHSRLHVEGHLPRLFSSFVYQVLSLPSAQGCQSLPIALLGPFDRFPMHKSCLLWFLCSRKGLLLGRKACLAPVVSFYCSGWVAMCSWCLNGLNASPEYYFNGLSLGWYALTHRVYEKPKVNRRRKCFVLSGTPSDT